MKKLIGLLTLLMVFAGVFLGACGPQSVVMTEEPASLQADPIAEATPLPVRTPHPPGQIFTYLTQTGDTLPAVAAHFNTTVEQVREANPELPDPMTTFPPGFPVQVPAYYRPLTGSPFQVLPDSEIVNGPSAVDFDVRAEILRHPGYLSEMEAFAYKKQRKAWEVVEVVAENYSVHPRLLLTLLEYQTQALTLPFPSGDERTYPMGVRDVLYRGLFWQLVWAAERLNDGYYGWRTGELSEYTLTDGITVGVDPWQNAGTAAIQYLFAGLYSSEEFEEAVSPEGFYQTYQDLWGEPVQYELAHIPGSLQQPELTLPFVPGHYWDFTGGPHPAWGQSLPNGALDFAPPSEESGCVISLEWVAAPADGIIARSAEATVILDLDGDGDERTGWVLFFFHMATDGRIAEGVQVKAGDLLGHPSCEGGRATGTHVHVARRYNGEWLPADGPIPFVMDGWVTAYSGVPYEGTLTKGSKIVPACPCSRAENRIYHELQ